VTAFAAGDEVFPPARAAEALCVVEGGNARSTVVIAVAG
jgi:hypothetical protein